MTKKICDCIGCNNEATIVANIPRKIVKKITSGRGVEIARYTIGVECVETDLCVRHVMILSDFFREVMR